MTDSENWPVYAGPPPRAAQGRRHKRDSHANKTGRSNVAGAVPGSPSWTNALFNERIFPAAAYPQLAAVAGAEGTAGKMPGLRKAESGGGARVNGKAKPLTAGLPSKPMN